MFADVRRGLAVAAVVQRATVTDTEGDVIDTTEFFGRPGDGAEDDGAEDEAATAAEAPADEKADEKADEEPADAK